MQVNISPTEQIDLLLGLIHADLLFCESACQDKVLATDWVCPSCPFQKVDSQQCAVWLTP